MMTDPESLAALLDQERRLQFPSFDNETAIALGLKLLSAGRVRGLPITVDVTRAGQQLFHAALPGTAPDNDQWVIRKNAVVMRFGHSSFYMGRSSAAKGYPSMSASSSIRSPSRPMAGRSRSSCGTSAWSAR